MQIQSYVPCDMRTAIKGGNVEEVKKILKSGFDPQKNLFEYRNITPVILALGYGSLPLEKGVYKEVPIELRKAKKIVRILQNYGASDQFYKEQSLAFMKAMNFANSNIYVGREKQIMNSMKNLLDEINIIQKQLKKCYLFVFSQNDFKILPKELVSLIANVYQSVNNYFD